MIYNSSGSSIICPVLTDPPCSLFGERPCALEQHLLRHWHQLRLPGAPTGRQQLEDEALLPPHRRPQRRRRAPRQHRAPPLRAPGSTAGRVRSGRQGDRGCAPAAVGVGSILDPNHPPQGRRDQPLSSEKHWPEVLGKDQDGHLGLLQDLGQGLFIRAAVHGDQWQTSQGAGEVRQKPLLTSTEQRLPPFFKNTV